MALLGAALFTCGGWALGQPRGAFPGNVGPDGPNRYVVSGLGPSSAVMVDSQTGRMWTLYHAEEPQPPTWLPL